MTISTNKTPEIKENPVIKAIETDLLTRIKQEADPRSLFYGELIKTIQNKYGNS